VFAPQRPALDAAKEPWHQPPGPLTDAVAAVPVPPRATPAPAQQCAAQRQALQTQVWAFHHQGWTAPAIAPHVGRSLRTVQRALRATTLTGCQRRSDSGDRRLTPDTPALLERWNAGGDTAILYTEALQTSPKMAMNPDNSESNTQRCSKFFTAVQGGIDPCHTGACRRGAALGAGRRSRLCQPSIMAFQEQARRTYTIRRAEGTWEEYLRNIRTLSVVPERWMCWSCFRFALYGITPAAGRVPARCGE
jgi:hypothetical protein